MTRPFSYDSWISATAVSRRTAMVGLGASVVDRSQAESAEVLVAQIGPFTGLPVPDALHINQGLKAGFGQAEAGGLIGARRIKLLELDDAYTPEGFVQAFRTALSRRAVALLSPIGSAQIKRMLDDKLLDRADLIVLNAIPGAESLRQPGHKQLFHLRAGDREQVEAVVAHATTLGVERLGLIYQDNPMGSSGLAVALDSARSNGRIAVSAFPASSAPADLDESSRKLQSADLQAVLVVGSPRFMADSIKSLRSVGFRRFIYALSYLPASLLREVVGANARGVALIQTFPKPDGHLSNLQHEFQAAMAKAFPSILNFSPFHLEGYITARVFVEAVRRAEQPTAERLASALRSKPIELNGFRVDFGRDNRGSTFIDIGVMDVQGRLTY